MCRSYAIDPDQAGAFKHSPPLHPRHVSMSVAGFVICLTRMNCSKRFFFFKIFSDWPDGPTMHFCRNLSRRPPVPTLLLELETCSTLLLQSLFVSKVAGFAFCLTQIWLTILVCFNFQWPAWQQTIDAHWASNHPFGPHRSLETCFTLFRQALFVSKVAGFAISIAELSTVLRSVVVAATWTSMDKVTLTMIKSLKWEQDGNVS